MFLPIVRAQSRARRQARLPDMCDCGAHRQLVDPLDARVGSLHPRDERSSHLEFGWSRPHVAPIVAGTPRLHLLSNELSLQKIELEMLLNFWGAAVDGMPENFKAPVCYEVGPWATSSSTRAR